jgi:hypothetical protein
MSQLRHFLLIYNAVDRTVKVEDLGEDEAAAAERYADVEEELRTETAYEVVLIGAESLDTIKTTHSHYFNGTQSVSPLLRASGSTQPSSAST